MAKLTYCEDCGIILRNKLSKYCQICYLHSHNPAKNPIIALKMGHRKENHPKWKGGRPKCLDCGKQLTRYDAKRCRSCSKKGEKGSSYIDGRSSEKGYCIDCKKEVNFRLTKRCRKCYGKYHSTQMRLKWLDSSYREKIIKRIYNTIIVEPNSKELKLNKLLEDLFVNEYKFVGNFKFWIEGFNPDFININGQKKIIEMFGDYRHRNTQERDKLRLKTYKKYGYKTLVIWEHELKNLDKVKIKILEFNKL